MLATVGTLTQRPSALVGGLLLRVRCREVVVVVAVVVAAAAVVVVGVVE